MNIPRQIDKYGKIDKGASAHFFAEAKYDAFGLNYLDLGAFYTGAQSQSMDSAAAAGLAVLDQYLGEVKRLHPGLPAAVSTNFDPPGGDLADHLAKHVLVKEPWGIVGVLCLMSSAFVPDTIVKDLAAFEKPLQIEVEALKRCVAAVYII